MPRLKIENLDDGRDLATEFRPGETLQTAIPRAAGELAGDGVPRALRGGDEIQQDPQERGTGRGTAIVVRHSGRPGGMSYPAERFRFATDPPQI